MAERTPTPPPAKAAKPRRRLTPTPLLVERVLPIALLTIALVGAPIMIFSRDGMPRVDALEKELGTVEGENTQLEREIEVLRSRVSNLRDDPAAIERLARDELGLIRQSEVVFQFPEER
jgi:cell division protein FtsB